MDLDSSESSATNFATLANPQELLSDLALKRERPTPKQFDAVFGLAILAIKTILPAAVAGNEQCKAVLPELLTLIQKLK